MAIPKILGKKDPNDSINMRVRIFERDGIYFANTEGRPVDFMTMQGFRKELCDPDEVKKQLHQTQCSGYLFANLGLSTSLTTTINGDNYAIVTNDPRDDFKDEVGKLVSGYVDARHMHNVLLALDEEMGEEFLPISKEGKLLPGFRNTTPIPRVFEGVLEYDDIAYQMFRSDLKIIDGLAGNGLVINGVKVQGRPQLYFQIPSNSAQIVFRHHIDIPSIPGLNLEHAERNYLDFASSSLDHAEDKFDNGALNITRNEHSLLLIKLAGDRLTDQVYTFEHGNLVPYTKDLVLSEAFAPKDNGIVTAQNITLDQYLQNA